MENERKIFNILVVVQWINLGIGHYFKEVIMRALGSSFGEAVFIGLHILFISIIVFYTWRYIVYHFRISHLICALIALIYLGVVYFCYIENRPFLEEYVITFATTLFPMIILGMCIEPDENLCKYLYRSALLVIAVNLLYYIYFLNSGRMWDGDNMTFNSLTIPSWLIIIGLEFRQKNYIKTVLVAIAAILFSILLGSRGGILCILVYIVLMLYSFAENKKQAFAFILSGTVVTLAVFIFWDDILSLVSKTILTLGGSFRVVELLQEGEFHKDTNRLLLAKNVLNYVVERCPVVGCGWFGDRVILGSETYVHNIFIEFLCNYGLIFGSVLFGVFIYFCAKKLKSERNEFCKIYFIILLSIGIAKLFVSGSYLTSDFFMLLIGYLSGRKIPERK